MPTEAMLWTNAELHKEAGKRRRAFRLGTSGRTRYRAEDEGKILAIVQRHVPTAECLRFGTNYILVSAPKGALPKLKKAAADINNEVEQYVDTDSLTFRIK